MDVAYFLTKRGFENVDVSELIGPFSDAGSALAVWREKVGGQYSMSSNTEWIMVGPVPCRPLYSYERYPEERS